MSLQTMVVQSLWTHGSSMQIEYPERLTLLRRTAEYTEVQGEPGSSNWFHFAVPTPVLAADSNLYLGSVFIRFKTESTQSFIKEVLLYDGEINIASFNDLELNCAEFRTDRFDPPLTQLNFGLGVSLKVVFGSDEAALQMKFSSAGANFAIPAENTETVTGAVKAGRISSTRKKRNRSR